ncbi:substrate-binding domain-containing protein [Lacipirellula sp.]|uniref:substrate-binding domain-containing protein n=1 Tax=Lacipirellula sp. TaxID=2691419 RepID=UPI003D11ABE3
MSNSPSLIRRLQQFRAARGWSQQQLADAAGLPRTNISAIEAGRLVPSTVAALRLAAAFNCRVEDLFQLEGSAPAQVEWAWHGGEPAGRYWLAEVGGRTFRYPSEAAIPFAFPHDGVEGDESLDELRAAPPTLVIACCDPTVSILAHELALRTGVRLLSYFRSSRHALELLKAGRVHLAGVHLGSDASGGNQQAVETILGAGYRLVHLATWEAGLVTTAERRRPNVAALVNSKVRWVGREVGSGARQCLDDLLEGKQSIRRIASDHRGVAEAVRSGWADAGVTPRVVACESRLEFLPVRTEAYDLCVAEELLEDRRFRALLSVLQSPRYRRLMGDVPGHQAVAAGELR